MAGLGARLPLVRHKPDCRGWAVDQSVKQESSGYGPPLFARAVPAQLDQGPGGAQVHDCPVPDAAVFRPRSVVGVNGGLKRYRAPFARTARLGSHP